MSDRNLEYIVNYIGPVLFVKKKKIQYKGESRKQQTCTNQKCSEHGKDCYHYHYCIKCGNKIEYIHAMKGEKYEVYPISLDDTFDSNYIPINKRHSNGVDCFNGVVTLLDDEDVYAPYFEQDSEFNCGIQAYIEQGKYCQNKSCEEFDECALPDHDYCGDCGHKNKVHKDTDIVSCFNQKDAKKTLKAYQTTNNLSACNFIEDERFDKVMSDFAASEKCKQGIKTIEKAYGKGSVTVRLAFVQYHQDY